MIIKEALAASLESIYKPAASMGGSNAQISTVLNPLIANGLILTGLAAFIVIILSGFTYISGAGDKNKLAQATAMLNYGILGLVVVVSAYLITRILGRVIGFNFF